MGKWFLNDDPSEADSRVLSDMENRIEISGTLEQFRELVEREVRRQNEWVDRQIWETDWTEVETVDIVESRPGGGTPHVRPTLKVYRYPTEGTTPDPSRYYSGSRIVTLKRLTREEYFDLLDTGAIEVPDEFDAISGPKGAETRESTRDPTGDDEDDTADSEEEDE